mmetsp:Transcript_52541/g.159248  ORF Transcript_52541/g.159248 Transcript_52541/m.159248 type:complete len:303 (-) Transcript_52541:377-1285(-)
MQTKAHLHTEFWQALQQPRMPAVGRQHAGLVDLSNDLDEGHHGHVSELALPLRAVGSQAPDEEEGVANVLVWCTMVVVHAAMHNFTHLVHEEHDLLFEHLSGVSEVPDVAEAYDGINLPSGYHCIHACAGAALHVLADDLCASLPEAQSQEPTQLDDGLLEDDGLHGLPHLLHVVGSVQQLPAPAALGQLLPAFGVLNLLPPVLQVAELHGLQGVVLDGLHLGYHSLDGVQQQLVGGLGERDCTDADSEADEDRLQHAEASFQLCCAPDVKDKHHVNVVFLPARLCQWRVVLHFGAPQLLVN